MFLLNAAIQKIATKNFRISKKASQFKNKMKIVVCGVFLGSQFQIHFFSRTLNLKV